MIKYSFLGGLYEVYYRRYCLGFDDFTEYTIAKSSRDLALTKACDDAIAIGLIPSYAGLIRYLVKHSIALDSIAEIIRLSAEDICASIPIDSQIISGGNKRCLSFIFDYIKKLVFTQ